MDAARTLALATVVGVAVGAGVYVGLFPDPALAAVVALVYAVAVGLAVRHRALVFRRYDDWDAARWSGGVAAIVLLTALVGLGPTLPISLGLRAALWVLVLGLTYAAYGLGIALATDAEETAPE